MKAKKGFGKKWVWAFAAVAAGAAILSLAWIRSGGSGRSGSTDIYKVAQAARGTYEETVSATGTLTAVGTVQVGTQVSGTVQKVLSDFNDRVKKGQVLAVLDQASFNAAVTVSEATVQRYEAELAQAQAQYDRFLPLFEAGHLSEQEFWSYRTALETGRASLRQARAELERNRVNLDNTVIRSPIDGTVIERNVDAGQTVAASLSAPTLFVIARDLSSMEIEVNVDENDIGMVRQGQEVRFTVPAYVDVPFSGKVSEVRLKPQVISSVVNYTVVVEVAETRGLLLPGMTATAEFVVKRIQDALLVPSSALRFSPERKGGPNRSGEEPDRGGKGSVLFLVGRDGQPVPARTAVLADNGVTAAVEANDALDAGASVVTGLTQESGQNVRSNGNIFSRLLPRPPRQQRQPQAR